jgi:hypothetical protein
MDIEYTFTSNAKKYKTAVKQLISIAIKKLNWENCCMMDIEYDYESDYFKRIFFTRDGDDREYFIRLWNIVDIDDGAKKRIVYSIM